MLASQALRSCSWLEHALAYRSRNASLSLALARDLLSQPRLSVALKISQSPIAAPKRLRCRSPKATATSCASEASICVICGFSESIRRCCISVIQISTETIRKRKRGLVRSLPRPENPLLSFRCNGCRDSCDEDYQQNRKCDWQFRRKCCGFTAFFRHCRVFLEDDGKRTEVICL